MLKMKIVMDDEKIKSDDEYSVEKIHDIINFIFVDSGLGIVEKNVYGQVSPMEYADEEILAKVMFWSNCEWFMKYVKEWLLIDEEDGYVENLLT